MAAPVWKIDADNIVANPEFIYNADGWVTGSSTWSNSGSSSTRYTIGGSGGSPYLQIACTGASPLQGVYVNVPGNFVAGETYTASIRVYKVSGSTSLQLFFGTSPADHGEMDVTVTTSWARYSVTWTPATTVTSADFGVRTRSGATGTAATFGIDSAIVENPSALTLTSSPYFLTSQQVPLPDLDAQYAASVTTEGDRLQTLRYRNRKVTLSLRVVAASTSALQTAVNDLQAKVGKINRDAVIGGTGYGGTLEFTTVDGDTVTFDVCSATMSSDLGKAYVVRNGTEVTLEFECAPFARGAEVDLGDNSETTLPCLIFTDTAITGDVPGLGRLVVDEDQAASQLFAMWGLRSKNYSNSADEALFYEAEGRTLQGAGAATASSATVYSGASYVIAGSLSTEYVSILSTQASGGGNYLAHIGRYRVWARMQVPTANTGTVMTALQWGVGDFRNPTTNTAVELSTTNGYPAGSWCLVDLGTVNIPPVLSGTQRWDGRIIAKSTVTNDDILIDCLFVMPVDEGYGEASAVVATDISSTATPTARDDFSSGTYSGDLAGDTLPTGGTWTAPSSGTGLDADDFAVTGGVAQRTAVSDTATDVRYGRWVYASGTSAMTATLAQVDFSATVQATAVQGLVLRAVDKSSFLVVGIRGNVRVQKVVSNTVTSLYFPAVPPPVLASAPLAWRLRVKILADGSIAVYVASASSMANLGTPTLVWSGQDSDLATGGALADGYVGIYDWQWLSTANTRDYDNFQVSATVADAACFASQSLEVRHNGVIREDSAGATWQPVSSYQGDYLLVPPAGKESRTNQMIVKMSRNIPGQGADGAIDDISAKLYVTPRYLQLPS